MSVPGRQFTSMSVWRVGDLDQRPGGGGGCRSPSCHRRAEEPCRPAIRLLTDGCADRAHRARAAARHAAADCLRLRRVNARSLSGRGRAGASEEPLHTSPLELCVLESEHRRLLRRSARTLAAAAQHGSTACHCRVRTRSAAIPFGSDTLAVVVSARQPLGGTLPQLMPWVIAILGVLLTVGASFLTYRLIWGGRRAQRLAAENRRLYAEQREIAQSVQQALLPEELPQIEGLQRRGALRSRNARSRHRWGLVRHDPARARPAAAGGRRCVGSRHTRGGGDGGAPLSDPVRGPDRPPGGLPAEAVGPPFAARPGPAGHRPVHGHRACRSNACG